MNIKELVKEIRRAAMELNMEVNELLEWIRAENDNKLPWEE